MHQISCDHRPLSFGLDTNADVARLVARSRLEPDVVGDAVVRLDKIGQARIDDRPHRVAQDVIGFAIAVPGLRARLGQQRPVLPLLARKQVARILECRYPMAVGQSRVPADMIDMQPWRCATVSTSRRPGRCTGMSGL